MQTQPPEMDSQTFLNLPLLTDLAVLQAEIAILGAPHGMPYSTPYGAPYEMPEAGNDQFNAPRAIRRASARLSLGADRWDFDVDGLPLQGSAGRVVDCGDVPGDPTDPQAHYQGIENAVRQIVQRGAVPLVLGGDHGITTPVLRGLDVHAPLTLVQVDAHLDWRDEVNGVREGYSSPMRRASEMAHIGAIYQVGLRAQGSARQEELEAARAYGARLFSAYEVHAEGIQSVLAQIPAGGRYYLTIDADGLDPSVMPAVAGPAAGGLFFHQVRGLVHGLAEKGRLVGMDLVEITPARDLNEISAITAGQLILNFIGVAGRMKIGNVSSE